MTKEQLKKIRDSFKKTVVKLLKEHAPSELEREKMFEKISIMYNRVEKLCGGNRKMAQGVIMLALEELSIEYSGGEFNYILNKLTKGV